MFKMIGISLFSPDKGCATMKMEYVYRRQNHWCVSQCKFCCVLL